ncbi:MAG: hypothetical protein DRO40_07385 [Thermoprotei archaeon]|nr:MAG: hypothetical protein DRO40_07385 [Thermoprotei archaeon]
MIILISLIIILIQLWFESKKRPRAVEMETKTLVKCPKCGYSEEREFQPGDFVSAIKGKCPKCGSPIKVHAIYAIELKTGSREKLKTPHKPL